MEVERDTGIVRVMKGLWCDTENTWKEGMIEQDQSFVMNHPVSSHPSSNHLEASPAL